MELRHLRYFVAVAEELNFSKAAQRLYIAQPPLSRQIRQLEEEIGVALLIRDRRHVILTEAGRVFLHEARALLGQASSLIEATQRVARGGRAVVRIGIAGGLGDTVYSVLVDYSRLFPALDFECKNILSTLQNDALREKQIDVGFMRPPVDSVLSSEALFEEPLLVLLPKKHPLAAGRTLRVKQLADEHILLHDRAVSSGVFDKILELFQDAGVEPKIVQTHTGPYEEAGAVLVASGKGVYIGSGAIVDHPVFNREVTAIPLAPKTTVEVLMAWRKGEKSSPILAFLDCVRNVRQRWKSAPSTHTARV